MDEINYRQTLIVPVGTTFIQKARWLYPQAFLDGLHEDIKTFKDLCYKSTGVLFENVGQVNWQQWRNLIQEKKNLIKYADFYKKEVDLIREITRRKNQQFTEESPDHLTAELAGLYLFYEHLDQPDIKDEVLLFASDTSEGLLSACFLAEYLQEKGPFKHHIGKVQVVCISSLGGDQKDSFQEKGLNNLVEQTAELIGERIGKRPLYLNITGGYKGALPYLTLLGMAFGNIKLFYLFEFSRDIVWLPKLPVGFDLLTWRDYRAFIRSIPHIEGLKEELLPAFIPDEMRTLLKYDEKCNRLVLNILGKALYIQYEKERGRNISEYGRGYLLTDLIICPNIKASLRNCIDHWQHLWIGDLIPETVEHGRGHVQRDLELLAQIIYPILKNEPNYFNDEVQLNDHNLLVLISALWLHDLGHSSSYLECDIKKGALVDGKIIKLNISGFPSMVRDIHHLLSWYLIKIDLEDLFLTRKDNIDNDSDVQFVFNDDIIDLIRKACLYHRGKMPVENGQNFKHLGLKINKPLISYNKPGGVNLPLIGALLRMADEGEVQRERTVSEEYESMRILQNRRELDRLRSEEKILRSHLKRIVDFPNKSKATQPALHDLIKHVEEYYNDEEKSNEQKDKSFDRIVEEYVRNFFSESDRVLIDCDPVIKMFYRYWLSALNQFIFKKRQPAHFKKHKGICHLMYIFNEDKTQLHHINRQEYHYDVLAIYRSEKSIKETNKYKHNAIQVLESINSEYEKIKCILNQDRIYFDSFWIMEEHSSDKNKVI